MHLHTLCVSVYRQYTAACSLGSLPSLGPQKPELGPGFLWTGTRRPHQGTTLTHMPHWGAPPLRSPVRSWRLRLLFGGWEERAESPDSFLSHHRLRCSPLPSKLMVTALYFKGLLWTTGSTFKPPSNQHTFPRCGCLQGSLEAGGWHEWLSPGT